MGQKAILVKDLNDPSTYSAVMWSMQQERAFHQQAIDELDRDIEYMRKLGAQDVINVGNPILCVGITT